MEIQRLLWYNSRSVETVLSGTWDDSNKGLRQRQKHQEVWKRLNLTVHSQNSERANVFLWPKTYCKLPCDSIKTNMNRVLKIWRKRNLWPFLLLLFICCKRNKKKEIKARILLHLYLFSSLSSFKGQGLWYKFTCVFTEPQTRPRLK